MLERFYITPTFSGKRTEILCTLILCNSFQHARVNCLSCLPPIYDPDMIREILLRQDEVFASRPRTLAVVHLAYGCGDVALAPLGPKWKQMRRICMANLLTIKRLESFALDHRLNPASRSAQFGASEFHNQSVGTKFKVRRIHHVTIETKTRELAV